MLSVLRAEEAPGTRERARKIGNRGRPATRSSSGGGGGPDWEGIDEGLVRVSGAGVGTGALRPRSPGPTAGAATAGPGPGAVPGARIRARKAFRQKREARGAQRTPRRRRGRIRRRRSARRSARRPATRRPPLPARGGRRTDAAPARRLGPPQEVTRWLPRADARRARLVCRAWRAALAALSTAAATPSEASTVTRWRAQLDSMVVSLPCLQALTVGSKLSDVGAQQLAVLAGVSQLRALRIPHGHSLRDRSIQVRMRARERAMTARHARMRGHTHAGPVRPQPAQLRAALAFACAVRAAGSACPASLPRQPVHASSDVPLLPPRPAVPPAGHRTADAAAGAADPGR
jgi:hypothetical protein